MTEPYYFISYSRQEITFVDSLSRELEKHGYKTWVDFRDLIPGHPWQAQLDKAIYEAESILLIVSKASLASEAVYDEWTKALSIGKRIILIIFEATQFEPSPELVKKGLTNGWEEIAKSKWIDFRFSFNKSMKELELMLSGVGEVKKLPPQSGFEMPHMVTLFWALSCISALLSIFSFLPVLFLVAPLILSDSEPNPFNIIGAVVILVPLAYIPILLIALPFQVTARTYQYRDAIIGLVGWFFAAIPLSIVIPIPLLAAIILAYTPAMYRWAGPGGTVIRSRKRQKIPFRKEINDFRPVKVAIEYSFIDKPIGDLLFSRLSKVGHTCIAVDKKKPEADEAEIVLVLLSMGKTKSEFDPESKVVIPILIETCSIHPKLSQIQWLDFRSGISSQKLRILSGRIHNPRLLLDSLGTLPTRLTPQLPIRIGFIRYLVGLIGFLGLVSPIVGIIAWIQGEPFSWLAIILSVVLVIACIQSFEALYHRSRDYRSTINLLFFIILVSWILSAAFQSPSSSLLGLTEVGLNLLLCYVPIFLIIASIGSSLRLWMPSNDL